MFSDDPINSFDDDLFGRKDFARRIAEIIAQHKEKQSIVIGLHAPWGEGENVCIKSRRKRPRRISI
jgi:predicted KAP-like P-loop ATPase